MPWPWRVIRNIAKGTVKIFDLEPNLHSFCSCWSGFNKKYEKMNNESGRLIRCTIKMGVVDLAKLTFWWLVKNPTLLIESQLPACIHLKEPFLGNNTRSSISLKVCEKLCQAAGGAHARINRVREINFLLLLQVWRQKLVVAGNLLQYRFFLPPRTFNLNSFPSARLRGAVERKRAASAAWQNIWWIFAFWCGSETFFTLSFWQRFFNLGPSCADWTEAMESFGAVGSFVWRCSVCVRVAPLWGCRECKKVLSLYFPGNLNGASEKINFRQTGC